ncbi:MAG: FHA domain-containing protein [Oscillospiraceae bacterium]|nr:FHA domain-containing protein [Oscillospiraceae bacterium]
MKRFFTVAAAVIMAISLAFGTSAAEVVSVFGQDDSLYAFMNTGGDTIEMKLGRNVVTNNSPAVSKSMAEAGAPIKYVVLLDCSAGMKKHIKKAGTFVDALVKSAGKNARFELARFGEKAHLQLPKSVSTGELVSIVKSKKTYSDQRTELFDAVTTVLDDIKAKKTAKGEQVNMILITDGVLYTDEGTPDFDSENVDMKAIQTRISKERQVVIHTVSMDKMDAEDMDVNVFYNINGLSFDLNDPDRTASEAAKQLTGFVNGLQVLEYGVVNFPAEPFTVTLTDVLDERSSFIVDNVEIAGNGGEDKDNESAGRSSEPIVIGKTQGNDKRSVKNTGTIEKVLNFLLVILLIILAAIIAVIVVLAVRSKKASAAHKGAIFMKVDVIQGIYAKKNSGLYLTDEIFIGSDRRCGIVFKDGCVSPQNTRVYLNNNYVYIEDLNSRAGTQLEGMQLYAPNRLRSGDEIRIGSVRFKIRF